MTELITIIQRELLWTDEEKDKFQYENIYKGYK